MGAAYEGWARLELFGHRVIAGYVREVEEYGDKFCQIVTPELPAVPADPANYQRALPPMPQHLQNYGGRAIYCLTPCDEQTARRIAERIRHQAITPYETRPLQIEGASAASEIEDDPDASDHQPDYFTDEGATEQPTDPARRTGSYFDAPSDATQEERAAPPPSNDIEGAPV